MRFTSLWFLPARARVSSRKRRESTDEDSILQLLTARSNDQRQQIKAAYKTMHGKALPKPKLLQQRDGAPVATVHSKMGHLGAGWLMEQKCILVMRLYVQKGSVSQSQGFGGGQDTHPTHMIRDDTPRLAIEKGSVNAHMKLVGFRTSQQGLASLRPSVNIVLAFQINRRGRGVSGGSGKRWCPPGDLVDDLKSELGGKFETLIVGLMTPPIAYDVTELRNAIKGAGTDEKVLVEIMASRTAQQVKDIISAYKQGLCWQYGRGVCVVSPQYGRDYGRGVGVVSPQYGREYDDDLEEDITGDTSGHFKRMMVVLLQASRQQGVDESKVEVDAQELFAAGEKKYGTDEDKFITILGNRSAAHLKRVFEEYMKISGYEIEESIQRETSGSLKDLLLAGAGTDDNTLIRIMVSRSEVDMLDIRAQFRRLFAKSLHSSIQHDTSGDYRKTLLLLCGGDDA
ncbi:hypothetical protein JZ751_022373 [Albula glossodonta]|uniref:Annexin n=1 Tax=Albula glossodonta TaxID=121402 RepID=A0A8T2NQM9_9TELE|nr:hypothetical protein JZ751_022373 [Albula glossodonta]